MLTQLQNTSQASAMGGAIAGSADHAQIVNNWTSHESTWNYDQHYYNLQTTVMGKSSLKGIPFSILSLMHWDFTSNWKQYRGSDDITTIT